MELPNILYAEDSALIADLTSAALRRAGFRVVHGKNGAEALRLYRAAPADYDLLFTDHEMPSLGGLGLAQALRQEGFKGGIIVNSGFLNPAERERYEASGPVEFLVKPSRASDLIAAVQAASAAQKS